jgi:hypothetical protein
MCLSVFISHIGQSVPGFNDSEGLDLITKERRKAMFLASNRSSTTMGKPTAGAAPI